MKKKRSLSNCQISLRKKKMLVNCLSILRIPLTIAFNFLLFYYYTRLWICIILFFVIILTDVFDGKLARYYKIESSLGSIIDSGADFFFVFTSNYLLYRQNLVPLVLVLIIFGKFLDFCLTSYILNKNIDKCLAFDPIGKVVALVLYCIPITVITLRLVLVKNLLDFFIFAVVIIVAILSLISSAMRLGKILLFELERTKI